MNPVFLDTTGPLIAAAMYAAATLTLWRAAKSGSGGARNVALGITAAAAVLHALLDYHTWMGRPLAQIDVTAALSLCTLVVVAIWASTLARSDTVFETGLFALPIAAAANVLGWMLPAPDVGANATQADVPVGAVIHVVSSVLAFGLLCLAGVYAGLVLAVDHSLKRHELGPRIRNLPPLDKLEGFLFGLVATGFVVLTIALASGLLYVDNLMAQHLVHKTVLACMAWLVFGALLMGRWLRGWRGATAVRLSLAGIGLLLLSYFGSKLVLEVILGRSWYA